MRGFGFIGAVGFLILLFIAGAIGFGLGQGAAPVTVPAGGAQVVYYGHPGWGGFGFGLLGFFLFLFLIFAVFGLIRRAAWGHRGWGHAYYGPGWDKSAWGNGPGDKSSWGNRPMPPFADEMLGRWHREAHGAPDTSARPTTDPKTNSQPDSQS